MTKECKLMTICKTAKILTNEQRAYCQVMRGNCEYYQEMEDRRKWNWAYDDNREVYGFDEEDRLVKIDVGDIAQVYVIEDEDLGIENVRR